MSATTAAATIPLNDLSRALQSERADLVAAMARVIDSGWLVQGPEHAAFETELADFLGVPHALGLASGTDALELAMRAVVPADRPLVATAANCGGYSTTAARRAGFAVRYADVDEATHLLTAETLTGVLDEQVGAVVVTHLYGRSADVAAVRALCEPLGVRVIEDCAQALGAERPEGRVGSLADVAAFSFYPTKNLGALGDGGAVATRSEEIARTVRELRQYGWQGKYTIGRTGGVNSRLDEVQAAVLRTRLPRLLAGNARRREVLAAYAEAAPASVRILPAPGPDHAAHLAVVVTDRREELVAHLAAAGVRTDVHYPVPDHQQPAFAAEAGVMSLPTTERLATSVLSLPLFPELRDDEVARVADALRSFS